MLMRIATMTTILIFATIAAASAFTITSKLTGDIRATNPENLIVDVTITVDTLNSPMLASWVVDINSPVHPDAKLGAFYFNLKETNGISFTNFDPTGWTVVSPAGNTQGTGGDPFMFLADKTKGNVTDVTNTQSLSFDMLTTFTLLESHFLNAPVTTTNATGSGQLGAHLLSLEMGPGNTTDSGFAIGSYEGEGGGGGGGQQVPVPEPSTLILVGAGLVGLAFSRRKR